ncbi:ECF transporter S component [Vagococcus sp. BWB3-3]|uniref:ECF transporter S component n=1 Tax=Vagococcus allomyrinae TaxID=2794353 RepID=A0A940SSW8_9ENTE|nr:ECF transporter S component [Vagococcus allomyrinae]MBP1039690.1 ECF transporter S component [Vagococcus allomyrinae]
MNKTRQFTLTAIFLAIIFLLAFTPIGFINLGFIKATIVHVPVIIASIVLGPRIGALLGGAFGLTSLVINTMTPSILSFAFSPFIPVIGTQNGSPWALVIAFVPRILVGIVPFYVYQGLKKILVKQPKSQPVLLFLTGVAGSLVNTIFVMNLIYFLFRDSYAEARAIAVGGAVYKAVLTVILINGVPEAIVAGIATSAVASVLLRLMKQQQL